MFQNFHINFLKKVKVIIITVIVSIIILISILNINFIFTNKYNITNICLVLLVLYVLNLIAYFFSIYQNSKYTSVIKFFWIRVYNLIWFLEFYLFIICIFLYIVSPAELKMYIDVSHQTKPELPNISNIKPYIIILSSVFLINYISYNSVYSNIFIKNILLLILTLVLVYLFINEIKAYYYYLQISNYKESKLWKQKHIDMYNTTFKIKNEVILYDLYNKKFSQDKRYLPPVTFILDLILCVKFLHIYLIVLFNLIFILLISLNTWKKLSLELIGLWQQNLIIVLIFWALNYIIFFKFIYKYKMYGVYNHIHFYKMFTNFSSVVEEFHLL